MSLALLVTARYGAAASSHFLSLTLCLSLYLFAFTALGFSIHCKQ
eukprot:SAG31_NODE_1367_length_8615_cov_12.875763_15_plen_45_part_00